MARLTQKSKAWPCRMLNCPAEYWMEELYGEYPSDQCNECPFMTLINKLADYEDKEYEECQKAVRHVIAITDIYETTKKEYMRAAMHSLKNRFDRDFIEQAVDELLAKVGEDEY